MISEIKGRVYYLIVGYVCCCVYGLVERKWLIYGFSNMFKSVEKLTNTGLVDYFEIVIRLVIVVSIVFSIPLIWVEVVLFVWEGVTNKELKKIAIKGFNSCIWLLSSIITSICLVIQSVEHFMKSFKESSSLEAIGVFKEYYYFVEGLCIIMLVLGQLVVLLNIWDVRYRRYVYMVGIIICGLISPPDMWMQLIFFLPIIVIFEIKIIRNVWESTSRYWKGYSRWGNKDK